MELARCLWTVLSWVVCTQKYSPLEYTRWYFWILWLDCSSAAWFFSEGITPHWTRNVRTRRVTISLFKDYNRKLSFSPKVVSWKKYGWIAWTKRVLYLCSFWGIKPWFWYLSMLTKEFLLYIEVLQILTPLLFALIFEDKCLFTFETWKRFRPWVLSGLELARL